MSFYKNRFALSLALIGALATQSVFAAQFVGAAPNRPLVNDIALQNGGVLGGEVVDAQGTAKTNADVVLLQAGEVLAVTRTDAQGRFQIPNLRAGVYQIETAQAGGVYRLWAPNTAPPAATNGVLLIGNSDTVRANFHDGEYGPAIRGGIAGALLGAGLYWALDHNPSGS